MTGYGVTPPPARRHSVDLVDAYTYTPTDPAKLRKAARAVVAWYGYPERGTAAWDEMVETLSMCGLTEDLR